VVGIELPIEHKEPWSVDTRAVRIPSTGGRILCHRPSFNDWRLSFTLSVDTDLISAKLVREIVDAAGKRIGLGDFRPSCKGPFGKFVVTLDIDGHGAGDVAGFRVVFEAEVEFVVHVRISPASMTAT
jgi:hypothetical protein